MKCMKLECSSATISAISGKEISISIEDVHNSDILNHFTIEQVIDHFDEDKFLDAIGEEKARKYFDIE